MLTPAQIAALRDVSGQVMDPIVDFLIEDIAKKVAKAGQFTNSAAYQAWKLQNLGISQKQLKKELAKRLKISQTQAERLMKQAAKTAYGQDIARFPDAGALPFAENTTVQQILDGAVKLAGEDLTNVTQTMGFIGPDGKCEELSKAYEKTCDFAFQKAATGAQDYASIIREATRNLADKGIRTIDYESGTHASLEAAVRRNLMSGLGLMNEQILQQNHDDLGCDGWEISAHGGCAPDHEDIQGKQYSDKEFEKLNNSLDRRIGTLNCGHSAMPIIMGVNDPQYTDEELKKFRQQNEAGIDFEGKHYTLYEAQQRQRRLESSVRKTKRKILIDESTGDAEKLQWDQIRLVRLQEEYHRFSKAANLPEQYERMEKAGFTWKHGNEATKSANAYYKYWSQSIGANESAKTLADYYEMKYNRPDEYKLLKQYAKDVKAGWISPLSGFENYKNLYGRIQSEIVGKTAANGTVIAGQVPHFMQRVIGTMEDPEKTMSPLRPIRRSGVDIQEIIDTVFSPDEIKPAVVSKSGKRSVKLVGKRCAVTINPDTGMLIQTNPL